MHELLPNLSSIRITQVTGRTTAKSVDSIDQLVLVLPSRLKNEDWRAIPQGARLKDALKKHSAGRRTGDQHSADKQAPDPSCRRKGFKRIPVRLNC